MQPDNELGPLSPEDLQVQFISAKEAETLACGWTHQKLFPVKYRIAAICYLCLRLPGWTPSPAELLGALAKQFPDTSASLLFSGFRLGFKRAKRENRKKIEIHRLEKSWRLEGRGA